FTHVEVRHRSGKLAPRAENYYLLGYNSHNRTWRLWNPANPTKIVNSVEVSFRDKATRDCPKESRRSARIKAPTEDGKTRHWSSSADIRGEEVYDHKELSYERVEYAPVTGFINEKGRYQDDFTRTGSNNYSETASGDHNRGWIESIREDCRSLQAYDVFEWVDPPEDTYVKPIPSKFILRWKDDKEEEPIRQKSRIVVQGFFEVDTGREKTAPVAHLESVRLVIALAARDNLPLYQLDVKTAFLQARMGPDDPEVYLIPPQGFE
ncbi:unnamed protein product, partial [Sphacelaria rigidula]